MNDMNSKYDMEQLSIGSDQLFDLAEKNESKIRLLERKIEQMDTYITNLIYECEENKKLIWYLMGEENLEN